ncbi:MAG: hypothetical protein C0484_21810 [Rhodospirillum sp.]|nr:hypothetical protein [Rhodospirillum sp.]
MRTDLATNLYDVLAPLLDFQWSEGEFAFAPGIWIRRFENLPSLSQFSDELSRDEWSTARETPHWLVYEWDGISRPKPKPIAEIFLLSLWLAKRTRTRIAVRFEIDQQRPTKHFGRQRMLDRFASIEGTITDDDFSRSELEVASRYYPALVSIYLTQGRLSSALSLTVSGCWSHFWQSAFICHAAAVECILTYSEAGGLTRRLGTSYACLKETEVSARNAAYEDFAELYSIRSDIMHGRSHNVAASHRLPSLARFQNMLRGLWKMVLALPELIAILDGPDVQRRDHFLSLQRDYKPPAR